VNYGYNQLNLLTSVTEPGPKQTILTYDVDDMREETRYPNGVTMYFVYDASNRIKRVWAKKVASGTILTDFTYEWKNASGVDTGLRHSVTDKDGAKTSYTYDPLNRLQQAEERLSSGAPLNSYSYTYDANSNRTSQTVNGVTTSYSHNAADQLTAAGSTTFTYDENGNERSASVIRSDAVYNAKDQLTSITPQGQAARPMSYTGPGQFLWVGAGSTTFQNSGLGLTRENSTSYTKDDDGFLLGMRTSTSNHYYLLDGLGSVAAVTDASGNVVATYSYEPFGKVKSQTGTLSNPYRWLGALGVYFDAATSLYKMGTRYYDPALGRFTQADPVPGGSANRYDYAAQDPVNASDPTGTQLINHCNVTATPFRRGTANRRIISFDLIANCTFPSDIRLLEICVERQDAPFRGYPDSVCRRAGRGALNFSQPPFGAIGVAARRCPRGRSVWRARFTMYVVWSGGTRTFHNAVSKGRRIRC
jgi:RHS repeat-associated protein